MDPDKALEDIRTLVASLVYPDHDDEDALRLAELIGALDAWLTNGGFLPAPWGGIDS